MPRFVHRRVIVFIVLLCQVLAGGIVHVPMASAAQVPAVAAASEHCHDGAAVASGRAEGTAAARPAATAAHATSPAHASSAAHPTPATHATSATHASLGAGDSAADFGHHCKTGFCGCVCAHAPAGVAGSVATPSPQASRPPLLVTDSVHSAPERATVFFRPPI